MSTFSEAQEQGRALLSALRIQWDTPWTKLDLEDAARTVEQMLTEMDRLYAEMRKEEGLRFTFERAVAHLEAENEALSGTLFRLLMGGMEAREECERLLRALKRPAVGLSAEEVQGL